MFEPLILTWKGNEYRVEPDRILMCIASVEDILTLAELSNYTSSRMTIPMAKLSMAFGRILRFAGANVTDQEVYKEVMKGDSAAAVNLMVTTLLQMMVPDAEFIADTEGEEGK